MTHQQEPLECAALSDDKRPPLGTADRNQLDGGTGGTVVVALTDHVQ